MTQVRLLDETLPACKLGEGAYWDHASASLYWVDIIGQAVHRYSMSTERHESWSLPKQVSFAYPNDGRFVVCLSDGVYDFDPATGSIEAVAVIQLPSGHRLNDGKLDPEGRLWVGTINTTDDRRETAALYLLSDGCLKEVENGYANANGKAWSPDGRVMYHADTERGTIWQFDYDLKRGEVSNKRVFVHVDGMKPDGLCTNAGGSVFAAIYGGSRVDVFTHRGELVRSIPVPVPNPTSCAVGGETSDRLFITSAFDGMTEEQMADAPLSGQTFVFNLSDW